MCSDTGYVTKACAITRDSMSERIHSKKDHFQVNLSLFENLRAFMTVSIDISYATMLVKVSASLELEFPATDIPSALYHTQ
jgi:hypothetical protein